MGAMLVVDVLRGPTIAKSLRPGWVRFADVEAGEVQWLWRGMIPLGSITLMEGPPGCGKSTILRDLAARITTGRELPFGSPPCPGSVLWVSSEEDLSTVLVPRLREAGADDSKIFGVNDGAWIEAQLALASMAAEHDARMIVLDNAMSLIAPDGDDYLAVQRTLAPWVQLAQSTGAALVGIRHSRKSGGKSAVNAGIGSIGWASVARATIAVGKIAGHGAVGLAKANLGPVGPPYSFDLLPEGGVCWGEQLTGVTSDDITDPDSKAQQGARKPNAADVLREILSGRALTRAEVLEIMAERGYAEKSVQNAATKLGIEREGATWRLPEVSHGDG